MKKTKRSRKSSVQKNTLPFLTVLFFVFAMSSAASYLLLKERFSFDSAFIADIEERIEKSGAAEQEPEMKRLYRAEIPDGEGQGNVVLRKDTLLVVAEDVIRKYLSPYKVRLLDLYMDKEGMIYIDLGSELEKSFRGDVLEEVKILSGLFSGVKATVPGFSALKILVEGREAESFGGHIDISKPIGDIIAKEL